MTDHPLCPLTYYCFTSVTDGSLSNRSKSLFYCKLKLLPSSNFYYLFFCTSHWKAVLFLLPMSKSSLVTIDASLLPFFVLKFLNIRNLSNFWTQCLFKFTCFEFSLWCRRIFSSRTTGKRRDPRNWLSIHLFPCSEDVYSLENTMFLFGRLENIGEHPSVLSNLIP